MPRYLELWQREQAQIDAEDDARREREIDQARDDWDRERGLLDDEDE